MNYDIIFKVDVGDQKDFICKGIIFKYSGDWIDIGLSNNNMGFIDYGEG